MSLEAEIDETVNKPPLSGENHERGMAERYYAAICSNGHILDYKDDHGDLNGQAACQHCGNPIHRVCPDCEQETMWAFKVTFEDGSNEWRKDDYCRSCENAFPWGPGRVTQFLHSKGVTFDYSDSSPSPRGTILTYQIREHLGETKYGNEVIDKVDGGDDCYKNELWHPALSMYVHAFEWAIITYLEDAEGADIIEQERNGTRYNLAGRSPSLLDVLTDKVTLDQKMIERIEDLNRAERRWMAHHKSGQVLRDEVESVRSRLGVLLGTLFEEGKVPNR